MRSKYSRIQIGQRGETEPWPICERSLRRKSRRRKFQRAIGTGPTMPTTHGSLKYSYGKGATVIPGKNLRRAAVDRNFGCRCPPSAKKNIPHMRGHIPKKGSE